MVFIQFSLWFASGNASEDHLSLTEDALQRIEPKGLFQQLRKGDLQGVPLGLVEQAVDCGQQGGAYPAGQKTI